MSGEMLRLTACFGERARVEGRLLADVMLEDFDRHGVHASVLMRGVEGFGLRHHLRTDRLLSLSEDLPVLAVALDEGARIEAVAEDLPGSMGSGLVTVDPAAAALDGRTDAVKLSVFLRRRQRVGGAPAFVAVCELLRRHGVAGATALLGVDGTAQGTRRRARFLSANADVPLLVVAVGAAAAVGGALEELSSLLTEATTIATEAVRVCKRDGETVSRPAAVGWQRLTLYSSESATVGGHAVHHELIRRLRRDGARGATAVRGIWGYHGEHRPHGDRLLQLRRRAPILTTVVDSGDRIGAWFDLADELTPERGLVTSEEVRLVRPQPLAS